MLRFLDTNIKRRSHRVIEGSTWEMFMEMLKSVFDNTKISFEFMKIKYITQLIKEEDSNIDTIYLSLREMSMLVMSLLNYKPALIDSAIDRIRSGSYRPMKTMSKSSISVLCQTRLAVEWGCKPVRYTFDSDEEFLEGEFSAISFLYRTGRIS